MHTQLACAARAEPDGEAIDVSGGAAGEVAYQNCSLLYDCILSVLSVCLI